MTHQQSTSTETLRRALDAIDRLQAELTQARNRAVEPIAIVGMGCRFPGGANSPEAYWDLLIKGRDAVSEVPPDRWNLEQLFDPTPGAPGKMYTRWGGFLDDIDQFDPAFFGLSAREAAAMDPAQRLALEVAWEALEDAGAASLAGSRTGVYIGASQGDYGMYQFQRLEQVSPYTVTGSALSVISGRIAYLFDLRGPAITVDTACSSALMAVHLAMQALQAGTVDTALAGGVNIILSPAHTVALSQYEVMLSPDGRCHAFDQAANGFVRGEGCGIVVLKRLCDVAAQDEVLAVLRGGATNQDGRSTGLSAPNVTSQVAVLTEALAAAQLSAQDVSYLEAHGTGTTLGDPIECEAIASVFTREPGDELVLGSVKTNLGHLEAAAGIAGLIKVVLALGHQMIPANLHFEALNPHISLERPPFTVPTAPTAWQPRAGRRIAGISSFGISGTNVHLVVEQAAPRALGPQDERRPVAVLPLSAPSPASLRALATEHILQLKGQDRVHDYCFSVATGRQALHQRLAVVGCTGSELAEALADRLARSVAGVSVDGPAPVTGFVFGPQCPSGEVRRSLLASPALTQEVEAVLGCVPAELRPHIEDIAGLGVGEHRIDGPAGTIVWTLAVARLLAKWGIVPDAVAGVGLGELTARCWSGELDLPTTLRIAVALDDSASGRGGAETVQLVLSALTETAEASVPVIGGHGPDDAADAWDRWSDGSCEVGPALTAQLRDAGITCCVGLGAQRPSQSSADEYWCQPLAAPDAWRALGGLAADLFELGVAIDWHGFDDGHDRIRIAVPHTPYSHSRVWVCSCEEWRRLVGSADSDQTTMAPPSSGATASPNEVQLTGADILTLDPQARPRALHASLSEGVRQVLGTFQTDPDASVVDIGLDQPLLAVGLDSLMAMGLRNQISAQLGVDLPIAAILQGTIRSVADAVLADLSSSNATTDSFGAQGAATPTDTEALLAELEGLSPEELDALFTGGE